MTSVGQEVRDFTRLSGSRPTTGFYGESLRAAARANPRLVCLTADLASATETAAFAAEFPERFVQIGIAEANMAGIAGGMARMGDIPFIHSFCVFVTKRCYDQISMQIAYPRLNVKIVGFLPGLTTRLGVSHQAIEDLALMRAMPNMTVLEPAGPAQVISAAAAALSIPGPVYLRMPHIASPPTQPPGPQPLEVGRAYILRSGNDGAILAAGATVDIAMAAADMLATTGTLVTVVNVSSIKPLDEHTILQIAAKRPVVLTLENHSVIGGLGSAISELLLEHRLHPRFRRVGIPDTFAQGGSTGFLFGKYGLSTANVIQAFKQASRR